MALCNFIVLSTNNKYAELYKMSKRMRTSAQL